MDCRFGSCRRQLGNCLAAKVSPIIGILFHMPRSDRSLRGERVVVPLCGCIVLVAVFIQHLRKTMLATAYLDHCFHVVPKASVVSDFFVWCDVQRLVLWFVCGHLAA